MNRTTHSQLELWMTNAFSLYGKKGGDGDIKRQVERDARLDRKGVLGISVSFRICCKANTHTFDCVLFYMKLAFYSMGCCWNKFPVYSWTETVWIYIFFLPWPFSFSYSPLVYNFLLCSLSPSLSPSVSYPASPCQSVSYFFSLHQVKHWRFCQ